MRVWRRLRAGWEAIFGRARVESELDAELRFHVEAHAEDLMRAGLSREEALRQARLKLGGLDRTKEECRDALGVSLVESVFQDMRFGLRMLRKNPGFTSVAVITLALGIGATTAMFTVMDGVVLKSLHYPDVDRIVAINTRWTDPDKVIPATTGGDLRDLRNATDCFGAFSYYIGGEMGVQLSHSAEFVGIYEVDPEFFHVFTIPPLAGRMFAPDDAGRAAVVSAAFAERNFGSAPAALSQVLQIDGKAYEIVGVMPPLFQFPRQAQVWSAVPPTPQNTNRTSYNYAAVARLRPGLSLDAVNARLLSLANRLAMAFPDSNRNKTFTVVPLQEQLVAPVRTTLFLLMGAVGLVLLIVCANVANLMLARTTSRVRELTMRAVLGAGRSRLLLQLLSESVVLALAACPIGIGLAVWGTKGLLVLGSRFLPAPLLADIQLDWRVVAFTLVVSFFTSFLFGIAPAWQAARLDLHDAIKQGGMRGLQCGPSRLRDLLVIAQIALSLMLAITASLFFRTILALHSAALGYRTERILVTYVHAPARTLPEALQAGRFFGDLFARLRNLPGVVSVAGAMGLPAGQYDSNGGFAIEGKQRWCGDDVGCDYRKYPHAVFALASPGYFGTMGIPLLQGRDFNDGDLYDRPFVAIVSGSLARQYFPHEDPIGHRIECGFDSTEKWMTVIGVVGDVRQSSPAAQPGPELYMPLRQHPWMANEAQVVVRTSANPEALIPAVQKTIREMNPEVAIKFTTVSELVSNSISAQRFRTVLASGFAALALLLALSGMYAVVSYVTAQRTAEFGLRSALGAQPSGILALVLRGAARLAVIGAVIGVLLSILAGRVFSSMLFGVRSVDLITYALVVSIVLPIVLLAAALPAWRASRVDPMVALRHE
jgi:predicted permease